MRNERASSKSSPRSSPHLGRPVLALTAATSAAKRRRSSKRAGVLSLENLLNGGADVFPLAEGRVATPNGVGPGAAVLPGSKNSARLHLLSAREPGGLGSASS